jgi:hypothetical protein
MSFEEIKAMRSKPLNLLFSTAVALVFVGMLTSGCKKHNSSPPPPSPPSQFSAVVDGSVYHAGRSGISSYLLSDSLFAVMGEDTINNTTLMVNFSGPFVINVPFTTGATAALVSFEYNQTSAVYEARGQNYSHATITITTYDTVNLNVAGTFSGVLYADQNPGAMDSVVVTAGSFNAYYPAH